VLLKEQLSDDWFNKCKAEMKPHKQAKTALKALHEVGTEKKRIKRILPDIGTAIKKISDIKGNEKAIWKNALWRFVSQFTECDAVQLVKIFESSTKPPKPTKKAKSPSQEKRPLTAKEKEQKRREKAEREEKKKKHRAELKRQFELSQKQGGSSSNMDDKRKSQERKRKNKGGKYDNSYEKYRRMSDFDPPSAPSMF